jgi:hypothetical protein
MWRSGGKERRKPTVRRRIMTLFLATVLIAGCSGRKNTDKAASAEGRRLVLLMHR